MCKKTNKKNILTRQKGAQLKICPPESKSCLTQTVTIMASKAFNIKHQYKVGRLYWCSIYLKQGLCTPKDQLWK